MSSDNGKIHKLEPVTDGAAKPVRESAAAPVTGGDDVQKDMSKVAMIVSLLAVLLLVIFFFA